MKTLLFVLMFFTLSALVIISNNNLALNEGVNLKTFGNLYADWASKIYINLRGVTGEVIQMNWLPE